MSRQRGLNSARREYRYNTAVTLLGSLERASGQTLGAFADVNIFKPLGMTGAYFNGDPVRTAPDHATRAIRRQRDGWRLVPESRATPGTRA